MDCKKDFLLHRIKPVCPVKWITIRLELGVVKLEFGQIKNKFILTELTFLSL